MKSLSPTSKNAPFSISKLSFLILSIIVISCNFDEMKFELKEHRELGDIPSASGLELTTTGMYVIGDNSPWLFKLDENFEIVDKIHLFPGRQFPDSIIEKLNKPDLEAIAKGNEEGTILLAFGSGSKSPERDLMLEIDLKEKISTEYLLIDFYSYLRAEAGLLEEELNIEAAEVYQDQLFLFNRGKNTIIKCKLSEFITYLKNKGEFPGLEIFRIDLPEIQGIPSGFSGASLDPDHGILYFTATVENTENWIDDGEVLGSFIGTIELKDLKDGMKPDHIAILLDRDHFKVKVESIAVLPPFNREKAELVMVTDSDGGISEVLKGTLFF